MTGEWLNGKAICTRRGRLSPAVFHMMGEWLDKWEQRKEEDHRFQAQQALELKARTQSPERKRRPDPAKLAKAHNSR